jgi:uncharacterized protein YoaH (UPF0181 family)
MTYDNADAEFSGETPAPRPAGEMAAEIVRRWRSEHIHGHVGSYVWQDTLGGLERLIAAALTATHEAAERERVEAIQKLNAERVECGGALTKLAAAERALALAREALESTREALFSYRSLAYGYAPMKTLEEYDDKHERALLPPPGEKP